MEVWLNHRFTFVPLRDLWLDEKSGFLHCLGSDTKCR